MELQAIETYYKGYKFRSRLEARWAVFLDACRADWEYEPEGFRLPDGSQYLPDFRVRNVKGRNRKEGDLYIEVKGVISKKDIRKAEMFAGLYCPSDRKRFCEGCPWTGHCPYQEIQGNKLLFVGPIPDPDDYFDFIRELEYKNDEPDIDYFYNAYLMDGDWFHVIPCADRNGGLHIDDENHNFLDGVDRGLTANAYRMARQARFEYGETPRL